MATKRPPPDPAKFNEAVDAFRELVPVPFDEFEALTAAEQAWAFRVAHVNQASVIQSVFDAIDSAILEGTTFREFKQVVGPKLTQEWGAPNAPHVETVFRTNTMRAYNEGRDAIMDKPAVRKARPYLRFDAVGDDRTSDICSDLDGTVKPADDAFWKTRRPPLHHNCRSILVPLSDEEARAEGISDGDGDLPPPAEGFGQRRETFDVDPERFDPKIWNVLKRKLGEAA